MDRIQAVADKHTLLVVEDAAQALGSRFNGKSAGTFGAFGTFSFYPAKLLGCFGDGGAIVTNDDAVAREIGLLRDHGRDESGRVVAWGLNSRLDNLQAAVLNHKFKTFPEDIARRRSIASRYQQRLAALPQLVLPPAPDADPRHHDVYQNYELQAQDRDSLRDFLQSRGIRTIIQWAGTPVHQFTELGFRQQLPNTEAFFQDCMMLPMNTALGDDDVDLICSAIKEFYARGASLAA
jgi:dTDP-4-amino-4,6-dideoxygalactose transaminase